MQCREIRAVCSEIHTKHRNTPYGQSTEFFNVNPGDKKRKLRVLMN
jgi:hypothetical protein